MKTTNPSIFVGGIDKNLADDQVEAAFAKFGEIVNISFKKGFCFIEYSSYHGARKAIQCMDG